MLCRTAEVYTAQGLARRRHGVSLVAVYMQHCLVRITQHREWRVTATCFSCQHACEALLGFHYKAQGLARRSHGVFHIAVYMQHCLVQITQHREWRVTATCFSCQHVCEALLGFHYTAQGLARRSHGVFHIAVYMQHCLVRFHTAQGWESRPA